MNDMTSGETVTARSVVVGGVMLADGAWRCACGEEFPNDVALFLHRQGVPHDELREEMQAAWVKAANRGGGNTPSLVIDVCAAVAREHFGTRKSDRA